MTEHRTTAGLDSKAVRRQFESVRGEKMTCRDVLMLAMPLLKTQDLACLRFQLIFFVPTFVSYPRFYRRNPKRVPKLTAVVTPSQCFHTPR